MSVLIESHNPKVDAIQCCLISYIEGKLYVQGYKRTLSKIK